MKGDIYIEREREREINLLFRLFMHLLVDFFKDFIYSLLERGERETSVCKRYQLPLTRLLSRDLACNAGIWLNEN